MNLLEENMVCMGFTTDCLFAGAQTRVSPFLFATIEGVVRFHSAFEITFGIHHSIKATQELVVQRSIQIILDMVI